MEKFLKGIDMTQKKSETFKNEIMNHTPIDEAMKTANINKAGALGVLVNNVISCYSILLAYNIKEDEYVASTEELKDLCVGHGKGYEDAFNDLVSELNAYCMRMVEDGGVITLPGEI